MSLRGGTPAHVGLGASLPHNGSSVIEGCVVLRTQVALHPDLVTIMARHITFARQRLGVTRVRRPIPGSQSIPANATPYQITESLGLLSASGRPEPQL